MNRYVMVFRLIPESSNGVTNKDILTSGKILFMEAPRGSFNETDVQMHLDRGTGVVLIEDELDGQKFLRPRGETRPVMFGETFVNSSLDIRIPYDVPMPIHDKLVNDYVS